MNPETADVGLIDRIVAGFNATGPFQQTEFILAIIGLVITIVGFLITGITAVKALKIAKGIKSKVIAIDSVSDLTKAHTIIDEISRYLRSRTWLGLPERCTALRHILVAVKSSNASLSDEHQKILRKAISTVQAIEQKISANIQTGLTEIEANKTDGILIKVSDSLNTLNIQVKQKVQ